MRLGKIVSASATLIFMTSCAASSGILPAGPDTYTVTERFSAIRGGSLTAQKVSMTEASQFCTQQGKEFFPLDMEELPGMTTPVNTGYSVTFRCLNPGDPELQRPNFQPSPNLVIENRSD